jgi:hypothetical protein
MRSWVVPVIPHQRSPDNDETENGDTVTDHSDNRRNAKRGSISKPGAAKPPDGPEMKRGKSVIGEAGVSSQMQGRLHAVGRQYGVQRAE